MKHIIKRREENLNEYQPDLCMKDFLNIKAKEEISREKIESFDYISSVFQGGHRRAGRDFFLSNPIPIHRKIRLNC